LQTQDWKCACAGLKEKREISWRSAVEAEEAMNKVGEQSKSPTFGFGCKPGGEETRSVLVEKVAEEKAGSNRKGRRDDREDQNAIRLPSNACGITYLLHPYYSLSH